MSKQIYFVMNKLDVTNEIFDRSINHSPLTSRYSLNKIQVIISFNDDNTLPFELLAQGLVHYSEEEMLEYISNNAVSWQTSVR